MNPNGWLPKQVYVNETKGMLDFLFNDVAIGNKSTVLFVTTNRTPIDGTIKVNDDDTDAIVSDIPEPSTVILLGLSAGLTSLIRK